MEFELYSVSVSLGVDDNREPDFELYSVSVSIGKDKGSVQVIDINTGIAQYIVIE